MNDLESLITSGSIVDLIFAVLLLELVWTVASKRFTRVQQIQRALHIGAGFSLLTCLKLALIQAAWWQIALGLATAGIIHLAEALIAQRSESPGRY